MIAKILVLVVLVMIAMIWLRTKLRGSAAKPPPRDRTPAAQKMLACAHCGVHLPATEAAFDVEGRSYCCGAHLDAHANGDRRP